MIIFLCAALSGSLFYTANINNEKQAAENALRLYQEEQTAKDLMGKEASKFLNQLAKVQLFENDNIASVFMMAEAEAGFISVTKKSDGNWSELKDKIVASIKATL